MKTLTLAADLDRRCVPRRRPRLRVVGAARQGVRKAAVASFGEGRYFVSVEHFTFAEWEVLDPAERPVFAIVVPEVGYVAMTMTSGMMTEEMTDIEDTARQWRETKGL